MKKRPGDVFRISTPRGYAYLHFVFDDPSFCELIRVLPGLYSSDPDMAMLVRKQERYYLYFPLYAAHRMKIVEYVGNTPLAAEHAKPRFMRSQHSVAGRNLGWHIVNTETLQRELVTELTAEQKRYSPWGVWNDTLLIERLVNEWSLDTWGQNAPLELKDHDYPEPDGHWQARTQLHRVTHYLYFTTKLMSDKAMKMLHGHDVVTQQRPGADGVSWLVLVQHDSVNPDSDTSSIVKALESIVQSLGGEYDGWEVELPPHGSPS